MHEGLVDLKTLVLAQRLKLNAIITSLITLISMYVTVDDVNF